MDPASGCSRRKVFEAGKINKQNQILDKTPLNLDMVIFTCQTDKISAFNLFSCRTDHNDFPKVTLKSCSQTCNCVGNCVATAYPQISPIL